MMEFDPAYDRLPLAQLAQRNIAFIIDFVICSFIGQLIQALLGIGNSWLGVLIFALVWLGDRVILAGTNKGQSVGRWAMSLRVVDMQYGRSANTVELLKREALLYFFVIIILGTYNAVGFTSSLTIFSVIPLVADLVIAVADSRKVQTFHDKLGGTIVVLSKKGFQLGRKFSKIFSQITTRSTQLYQDRYQNRKPDNYQERYQERDSYEKRDRYDDDYYDDVPTKPTRRSPRRRR